jgi:threonine/homoserine efflux transporter RhtA
MIDSIEIILAVMAAVFWALYVRVLVRMSRP